MPAVDLGDGGRPCHRSRRGKHGDTVEGAGRRNIRRVIAECDLVVTHSLATGAVPVYGPLGSKVVDIFRLDENGKIVEHWDVLAQISPTSANGNPEV